MQSHGLPRLSGFGKKLVDQRRPDARAAKLGQQSNVGQADLGFGTEHQQPADGMVSAFDDTRIRISGLALVTKLPGPELHLQKHLLLSRVPAPSGHLLCASAAVE